MRKCRLIVSLIMVIAMFTVLFSACGAKTTETELPKAGEDSTSEQAAAATEESSEVSTEDTAKNETTKKDDSAADSGVTTIYPDKEYADKVDSNLIMSSADNYTRTRSNDAKSGDIVDMSIYKEDGRIVKIVTEDYGSEGLVVSELYYNSDNVAYMKQHKTDIYGINSSYTEADFSSKDADYTMEVLGKADETLVQAKKDKGMTLLYGYAGDEQGGVLENVTVKLRNVAGDVNKETVTDGDGYYTFELPQTDDTYNLTYSYGTWADSSLNDIHIVPGTPEYSLGRVYVAPAGQAVHDTDVYLLNPNTKSPVKLKDGEYLAEIGPASLYKTASLKMALSVVNKDDQSRETGTVKFNPSKSKSGYAIFVEDVSNLGEDDMAGLMGRSYLTVTIYDKDGIVAAYPVPAGRLGTIWKVCDISNNGDISISGIMYTDSKGWYMDSKNWATLE